MTSERLRQFVRYMADNPMRLTDEGVSELLAVADELDAANRKLTAIRELASQFSDTVNPLWLRKELKTIVGQ